MQRLPGYAQGRGPRGPGSFLHRLDGLAGQPAADALQPQTHPGNRRAARLSARSRHARPHRPAQQQPRDAAPAAHGVPDQPRVAGGFLLRRPHALFPERSAAAGRTDGLYLRSRADRKRRDVRRGVRTPARPLADGWHHRGRSCFPREAARGRLVTLRHREDRFGFHPAGSADDRQRSDADGPNRLSKRPPSRLPPHRHGRGSD